jgi:hypothetical protein
MGVDIVSSAAAALTLVVMHAPDTTSSSRDISVVKVGATTSTRKSLGFLPFNNRCGGGSGKAGVWAAIRRSAARIAEPEAGQHFDVYAADAMCFYVYWPALSFSGGNHWATVSGNHVDTWSMAFSPTYDPSTNDCTAYTSTDGGIERNASTSHPPFFPSVCFPGDGWVVATSGLHTLLGGWLAGVSRPNASCGEAAVPCPALWLPTADNDVWFSPAGGLPLHEWQPYGANLGDAGRVLADPALPGQILAVRNGNYHVFRSTGGAPPGPGSPMTIITPPNPVLGVTLTPGVGAVAQILTLPNERPAASGDYLAVTALPDPFKVEMILRNQTGDPCCWRSITTASTFSVNDIAVLQASGGHAKPTIYVLTRKGGVLKGRVEQTGDVTQWTSAAGSGADTLRRAVSLFVNPYDPNEAYAADMDDKLIKSTRDGGATWQREAQLVDLATGHGTFRFDCSSHAFPGGPGQSTPFASSCALNDMFFPRDQPRLRFAVVSPGTGVALSRDGGRSWIPLDVTSSGRLRPLASFHQATATFYDPQPRRGTAYSSLYVALADAGIIRIDAPFKSLGAIGFICPRRLCEAPPPVTGAHHLRLRNEDSGSELPVVRGEDGLWRARELFDTERVKRVRYLLEIDGRVVERYEHEVTEAERGSGVVELGEARARLGASAHRAGPETQT